MVSWQVLGEQAVRLSVRDRLALLWKIVRSLWFGRVDRRSDRGAKEAAVLDDVSPVMIEGDRRQEFLHALVARMQQSSLPESAPHFNREMLHERR